MEKISLKAAISCYLEYDLIPALEDAVDFSEEELEIATLEKIDFSSEQEEFERLSKELEEIEDLLSKIDSMSKKDLLSLIH